MKFTTAAGYEREVMQNETPITDDLDPETMRAQFEAEFTLQQGVFTVILGREFYRKHDDTGDYYYPEAHFAWLGYQLAKGVK